MCQWKANFATYWKSTRNLQQETKLLSNTEVEQKPQPFSTPEVQQKNKRSHLVLKPKHNHQGKAFTLGHNKFSGKQQRTFCLSLYPL